MSASDTMIERYGIEDAERYRRDHQALINNAVWLGAGITGLMLSAAMYIFPVPKSNIPPLLSARRFINGGRT